MKISKTNLEKIIREEYSKLKSRGLITEGRPGSWAVDIQDPAEQAEWSGMSHGEYVQPIIKIAEDLGLRILEDSPEVFTVSGSKRKLIEFGFQMNQLEGGPAFNKEEYLEYAVYKL